MSEPHVNPQITIAHAMQVNYDDLLAQAGLSIDTTVRIQVDPLALYPDYVMVALLWMAQGYTFHTIDLFNEFRSDFEDHTGERYQQIIDHWPMIFGQPEKAMKRLFAAEKPVVDRPPYSTCPRCGKPLWAREGTVSLDEAKTLLEARPAPLWCMGCGQRFAYEDGAKIKCTAAFSSKETIATLDAMFKYDQPTLQLEAKPRHEGGNENAA